MKSFSFKKYHLRTHIWDFETFSHNKKIIFSALVATIGIILKFIEIPTFSTFLKLDFALLPIMILIFIGGSIPYVLGVTLLIDLVSLRGSIYGWIASLCFSLAFLNTIYILYNSFHRKQRKLSWFVLYSLSGALIATLFLFVLNTYFITPAFFGTTYSEISNPKTWKNISVFFFSIPTYELGMFLFYSTFNFLLKTPVLIILFCLVILPLFYIKRISKS